VNGLNPSTAAASAADWRGIGDHERSLCGEHFRRHNLGIGNHHRQKRNQNLTVADQCYTPFRLPNIC
jgi:hypothetical protein